MRLSLALALLSCVLLRSAARERPQSTNDLSLRDLRTQLASHVSEPRFAAAMWGVKVVSLVSGAVLFETNATKLLKPASNTKLYTGALALETLGPEYRIKTSLYARPEQLSSGGILQGDLIVYGRGDPTFSARFQGGRYTNLLAGVVQSIQDSGVKRIEGDLIGDDTFFRGPHFGATWAWDDLEYYYGAEVSALTFQDNVIDLTFRPGAVAGDACAIELQPATTYVSFVNRTRTIAPHNRSSSINIYRPLGENKAYITGTLPAGARPYVDAVTVHNAALWFATMLKASLEQHGVFVAGHARARSWPQDEPLKTAELREIGSVQSPPLSEIIEKMMKASQNLYAQLLLLQVGANAGSTETAGVTTEDLGLRELRQFTRKAGIKPGEMLLEEGSGLSRGGLVTPAATVQLLSWMAQQKDAALFESFLPVAGTDGTLRFRLHDLKGNVRAKTGTLRYVNTLSGFMTNRAGEELVFSIMLNGYHNTSSTSSRDELDVIPRLLSRVAEKSVPQE